MKLSLTLFSALLVVSLVLSSCVDASPSDDKLIAATIEEESQSLPLEDEENVVPGFLRATGPRKLPLLTGDQDDYEEGSGSSASSCSKCSNRKTYADCSDRNYGNTRDWYCSYLYEGNTCGWNAKDKKCENCWYKLDNNDEIKIVDGKKAVCCKNCKDR